MKVAMRGGSRRALIMLAVALAVYGLANWVVIPAYDRLSASAELASEKETQLKRYRRAELRKGQYVDLLKLAADRVGKNETVVISAANLSLASAELQSMIEGSANRLGVMVGQRSIGVPRRLNDYYAEISMTLNFDSTPGQLVSFLNELQTLPRFVTVRVIQVSPVTPVFEAPKGIDLMKNVHVTMTVSSLCPASLVKQDRGTR